MTRKVRGARGGAGGCAPGAATASGRPFRRRACETRCLRDPQRTRETAATPAPPRSAAAAQQQTPQLVELVLHILPVPCALRVPAERISVLVFVLGLVFVLSAVLLRVRGRVLVPLWQLLLLLVLLDV